MPGKGKYLNLLAAPSGPGRAWYLRPASRVSTAIATVITAFALVVAPLPWTPDEPAALATHEEFCYLVADAGNTLTRYDRVAMTEAIIGPLGVSVVEAIALDPDSGVLYGANASTLGTINTATGAYNTIGSFGTGSGPLGNITFSDVDGLAFDPTTGILWGSQFLSSQNVLIQIDPATGAHIPGVFAGDDYLVVSGAGHIDDIAIEPGTGVMYASDSPGGGDTLLTINTTTGVASAVGPMGTSDMEGLSIDPSGNLLGTNGNPGSLYRVNKATGNATFEANLGPGTLNDYEAAACLTTFFAEADLELTKSVNNATPVSGETVTFTVTVNNVGPHDTGGVTVSDPLPVGLTYVSDDSGGNYNSGSGVWTIGTIANGGSAIINIDATVPASGTFDNIAEVRTADLADPDSTPDNGIPAEDDQDNAVVTVQPTSISLVKSLQSNADEDGSGDVTLGDTLTYQFVATNTGTVNLTNVNVSDPLPGLSAISCIPAQGTTLIPAASMTCSATYSVTQADVDSGSIDNTATAVGTPPTGPNVTDDSTVMTPVAQTASIVLAKTMTGNADEDGSGDVSLGDTLTYTFVATNNGTVTLNGVAITDPLPGLSGLGCVPAAGSSLAPSAAMTCTATYTVTQTDVNDGSIDNTATVDATDPGGSPLSDTDDETVPVPQSRGIALDKSLLSNADEDGSGDVTLGDTLTYQFVVTNTGNITLTAVGVSDPLPGLSALACVPVAGSSLAPGATMTCSATYTVTQPDVDNGQIDNIATASGTPPTGPPITVDDPETVPVEQSPSIALIKSLFANADEDGSGDVTIGDTLTYEFVATNNGSVTLSAVAISDPLPGLSALTCAPAAGSSLAPTETMTCTATYSVTQSDVDNGQIDNTATVNGTDPGGNPVSDNDSASVVVVQTVSISLVKSLQSNADEDGSGDVSVGDTLTYQFVANNDGTVTLNNVAITDPLPGLSALACVPIAGSSLAPGGTMNCTATYVVTQTDVDSGSINNTATVNAIDPDGNPVSDTDSETVVPPQSPSIDLVKTLQSNADEDGSGDVSVGDTLTYQFVTTNDGNVTLSNVTVTDPLPGLSTIGCAPAQGSSLAPSASMTCTATYSVTQADVDAGAISNTATTTGTPPIGPDVTAMDSVTIPPPQAASIVLVKSLQSNADEDGSGDVSVGDTLTYQFVATNDGNVTLDNVTITDPLPGLSALVCVPAPGSTLVPGAAMTCTATYSVTQADIDAGAISNTATVTATDPLGNPVSDMDMETVVPPQNPSIVLVKSLQSNADEDGSGNVTLGDTLTYSFLATNDGDVTLSLATITDPLPGLSALTCVPAAGASLAPGAAMSCSATYSVAQADVDAGTINNTAGVTSERPGGDPGDPADDITDTDPEIVAVVQSPSIALVKSLSSNADEDGSGDVTLGDTLTYGFVVTNDGTVTLTNVSVTDPLPGLSGLTCVPVAGSSLAPSETMTCSATYSVAQADVDNGQIDNTATASGNPPSGPPVTIDDPETVIVEQSPSIALVKSLSSNADEDGSGTVSLNDTLTYQFVVTNDGTVTLTNVSVTDPLPGLSALTCVPVAGSALAPGETMSCTATYSVAQADVDNGQIDNTATASGTPPSGPPITIDDPETVAVPQTPSIVLTKTLFANADEDGSGDITLGDTLTYRFIANNDGNVTLDVVTITDPLPGLSALVCVPLAGASLAPTETMTCTASYSVTQADVDSGQIDNTATVNSTDPDGNPVDDIDNNSAIVAQTPSILLTKVLQSNADEDGSGDVTPGDTLTYSFVATNDGTVTLDNVAITDPLPGLSALTCAPAAGSSLAPTESMSCTATYSVTQADADNGQIDNTATVAATDPDSNPVGDTDDETVPVVQSPLISLVKGLSSNADEDGSGTVTLNDTLTYQFVATNTGTVTLNNVAITDPLPGLSALVCLPAAGSSLAPTASMTCSATYSVTQADVDNGQIDNTASVNATDPGGNPVDDTDDEMVPVAQSPSIALAKSLSANADEDGSGDVTLGDTLTYQLCGDQ